MKQHSERFLKKRRFYMVLPLLVLPFVVVAFWALGGGKASSPGLQQAKHSGFNPELPGAHFSKDIELWDKLSLYEQSRRDSLDHEEARRNDPYYVLDPIKPDARTVAHRPSNSRLITSFDGAAVHEMDQNEAMVSRKLEELTRELDRGEMPAYGITAPSPEEEASTLPDWRVTDDVDRLEAMMTMMQERDVNDPEMQKIEGVLEKILDIQHPERVKERIRTESALNKGSVFPVQPATNEDNISFMENETEGQPFSVADSTVSTRSYGRPPAGNRFYGLDDKDFSQAYEGNAIEAVVHGTQTVVGGAVIKLRLLSEVYINGHLIEKGKFIHGVCRLNGERLSVSINAIRDGNALFPVSLSAFDLDGMEGIHVPGAMARDAARESSGQSIQDLQFYSMDNSLEVQAATAGVEVAKGLLTKKAKLVKVTVKAGYRLLLRDADQRNR